MKKLKQFRTLILIGAMAVGIVTLLIWLPFKAGRQRLLDTDLINALNQGKLQEVRLLLKAGANPNACDLTGVPPKGMLEQIGAFIKRSPLPEIHRASALSCATNERTHDQSLNADLVKLLLDHGADVKRSEHCDAPPLVLAAQSQDFTSVFLLLKYGADPNVRSLDGRTALRNSIELA